MIPRAIPATMDEGIVASIDADLAGVETRERVRILLAVESGSRAWGFPSPDSDYDCRFFYLRPTAAYLALTPPREMIELPVGPVFDVSGWDLQKALRLLVKGNAVVNEWLTSPIVYRGEADFREEMAALAAEAASPSAVARHYISMGRTAFAYFGDGRGEGPLKKLLYALRPALALDWMAARPGCAAPPMNLHSLIAGSDLPDDAAQEIAELIALKSRTREMGLCAPPPRIAVLLQRSLDAAQARVARGDFGQDGDLAGREAAANRLFQSMLERRFGPKIRDLTPQF